jgi:hypothetical protein
MHSREEGGIDPLNFVPHLTNDHGPVARKLGEQEGQEMAGPPLIDSVRDHLGVTLDQLTVDWVVGWEVMECLFDDRRWSPRMIDP